MLALSVSLRLKLEIAEQILVSGQNSKIYHSFRVWSLAHAVNRNSRNTQSTHDWFKSQKCVCVFFFWYTPEKPRGPPNLQNWVPKKFMEENATRSDTNDITFFMCRRFGEIRYPQNALSGMGFTCFSHTIRYKEMSI